MTSHTPQPWTFTSTDGTFTLDNPHRTSYLYFPLVNEAGMVSAVTPTLHGDAKSGQHSYLLEPVSVEDLHSSRAARNFWVTLADGTLWSATGNSAAQLAADDDQVSLEAGFLWQKVTRTNAALGLKAEITSVVPSAAGHVELMKVTLINTADAPVQLSPTAAVPIYGRSADSQRDHRHVTSLLHRIRCGTNGVLVTPTLSFDERGHHPNTVTYSVQGADAAGAAPVGFFPIVEDFIGEGGTLDWPRALTDGTVPVPAGDTEDGYEAMGGLRFAEAILAPGASVTYVVVMAMTDGEDAARALIDDYGTEAGFNTALAQTSEYWLAKLDALSFDVGDAQFNGWARWVTIQPILRRMLGNSYLPYHDYGRGGRGWRDLWQDILALLLMESDAVDGLLYSNYAGVRVDGSNATIIGSKPGEFKADRNDIPRVWMDHGAWPLTTTLMYIDQSGDLEFVLRPQTYFKDVHTHRCGQHDAQWNESQGTVQRTAAGEEYQGTILEHLLLQHLTVFFHVGEHHNILLEGADWNDGMDMARTRGESVAFTAYYAANFRELARLALDLKARGIETVELAEELTVLLDTLGDSPSDYGDVAAKHALLQRYFDSVAHSVTGKKVAVSTEDLAMDMTAKSVSLTEHLRANEWVTSAEGYGWFNGYYDDDGHRLEGEHPSGVRMTLTGQVFALMGGIATETQATQIVAAADRYLFEPGVRGYRLNSNFHEVMLNVGRCFGFAFGHKENGAMFSHMACMYAYALYERGFVAEGHKVLDGIFQQSMDFGTSRMYPGVPEYFSERGRGMYTYLTGSASWYLLTLVTQAFGVRGVRGDLQLAPKLVAPQFDADGNATITTLFADRKLTVTYRNPQGLDAGDYSIGSMSLNGADAPLTLSGNAAVIARSVIEALDANTTHRLDVQLVG
ncbi:MAG: cellobiose phosphorylase [Actinobacteria bacterium HGW-Actinobacteria-4]|nr:MAG: cellobiose phosphorylase [Actinobacteria bacterium HGW-Actinobacteria-4]